MSNTVPNAQQTPVHFDLFSFPHSIPQSRLKFQIGLFIKQVMRGRVTRSPCDVENETNQRCNKSTLLKTPVPSHTYFINTNSLHLIRSKYSHLTKQKQNPTHSNSYRGPKGSPQVHLQTSKTYKNRKARGRGDIQNAYIFPRRICIHHTDKHLLTKSTQIRREATRQKKGIINY